MTTSKHLRLYRRRKYCSDTRFEICHGRKYRRWLRWGKERGR